MPKLEEYSVAQLRRHISKHNKKYRVSNYWRVPKKKLIEIIESGQHHLKTTLYQVVPAKIQAQRKKAQEAKERAKAKKAEAKKAKAEAKKAKAKKPRGRAVKGAPSKTHKGRMDYTTKRGDKDYHQQGHDVKKANRPYKRKGKKVAGKKHKGKQVYRARNGAHYIIEDSGAARFIKKK